MIDISYEAVSVARGAELSSDAMVWNRVGALCVILFGGELRDGGRRGVSGELQIEVDRLREAARFASGEAQAIRDELLKLDDAIGKELLAEGWQGKAASAYDESWLEWKHGSETVIAALEESSADLAEAAASYFVGMISTFPIKKVGIGPGRFKPLNVSSVTGSGGSTASRAWWGATGVAAIVCVLPRAALRTASWAIRGGGRKRWWQSRGRTRRGSRPRRARVPGWHTARSRQVDADISQLATQFGALGFGRVPMVSAM
ncbi:WXG100 family type VII secretion target [Nocardia sp. NPDC049707]|uniref:WXG100 family type VII secretion target n=1 Tax=Nocardia sp. NPDC049707 TaxID=3154735 RepID=UPI00342D4E7F